MEHLFWKRMLSTMRLWKYGARKEGSHSCPLQMLAPIYSLRRDVAWLLRTRNIWTQLSQETNSDFMIYIRSIYVSMLEYTLYN